MLPGRGRLAIAMAVATVVIGTGSALAAPPPGPEWPLHAVKVDDQNYLDMARLPGGGFVAAWKSENHTPSGDAVIVRRFDAGGAPVGDEKVLGAGNEPAVAAAPDGRFVVVWQVFDSLLGNELRAQTFAADGSETSSVVPVNDPSADGQETADVAMGADGTFVVVWETQSGPVPARRFGPNATSPSDELVVGSSNTNDSDPAVVLEPGGGFVVAWTDQTVFDVMVRRYDASNLPAYDAKPVAPSPVATQSFSDIELTSGGFVVVWDQSPGSPAIQARLFGSDGTPQGAAPAPITENTSSSNSDPDVARGDDGSIIVAWDGPQGAVARRFDAALAPLSGEIPVAAEASVNSAADDVIGFADRYVVGFERDDPDPLSEGIYGSGVFARSFPFDPIGGGGSTQPPAGGGDTTTPPAGGGGGTPTPPASGGGATTTPPPSGPAPPPLAPQRRVTLANVLASVPSTRRCVSRRRFRIRLRHPRGARLASATVRVNGKRVATRRGRRVTAPVDLRGLPRGRFTVEITVKLADGRTVKGKRRYRTCAPKRRGGRPRV